MKISCANTKTKKGFIKELYEFIVSIFGIIILASLMRWAIAGFYAVSSGSMEQTILTGDCLLVSKLHYGPCTPITPLQLPMTHRVIPGTKTKSYSNFIQLPPYRLPGFGKVKRNDIIIFNSVDSKSNTPVDMRDYWIKRCVGLPGDLVSIQHKQVYINNTVSDLPDTVQYRYFMKTQRYFPKSFFDKVGITEFSQSKIEESKGYKIYTTPKKVAQLKQVLSSSIDSIDAIEVGNNDDESCLQPYPWNKSICWDKDNFGPLTVPKKGMTIPMNQENMLLYKYLIERFEGKKEIQFVGDRCWIDGCEVTQYTFSRDYYFVLGDNRDQSKDSRFIGFIPEEHIIGKAILVIISSDKQRGWFRGIRWNRIFHKLS